MAGRGRIVDGQEEYRKQYLERILRNLDAEENENPRDVILADDIFADDNIEEIQPNNDPANPIFFDYAENIEDDNQCTICYDGPANFTMNSCVHRFCERCLRRLRPQQCPNCRRRFTRIVPV